MFQKQSWKHKRQGLNMYNYSEAIKILDGWKNLNQLALDMFKCNRKKEEGELQNMNNLESEFYPWLAEKIGVKLGERFVLKENLRSFIADIRENGVYHSFTNDKLNGNTVNQILNGTLKAEKLPWCPKADERYLEVYGNINKGLELQVYSTKLDSVSDWLKLEAGFIFPYTEDKDKRAEYVEQAKWRIKQIMVKHGISYKE